MHRLALVLIFILAACSREDAANDSTHGSTADNASGSARESADGVACTEPAVVAPLPPMIREASGIAFASDTALLWIHNDSEGSPVLYAIGTDGALRAQIDMPHAPAQFDWEDLATGPCPSGTCLYIGDIGDNVHERADRAILRVAEPVAGASPAVETFPFMYPGGPQDAEAIFVLPDTSVYVLSKGRRGPVVLFRYPPPLRPGQTVMLEEVQRLSEGLLQLPDLVTGAAARPDGRVVAIRTYSHVNFYSFESRRLVPLLSGPGIDLTPLHEPQGEGIALAADGSVFLVSEAGLEGRTPSLSTLRCRLP
jgi:hypothetical protein